MEDYGMLLEEIEAHPAPALASDFGIRVLQAVDADHRQKKRSRIWIAAGLSVAASLAITVIGSQRAELGGRAVAPLREIWSPDVTSSIAAEAGRLTNKQIVLVGKVADGFKPVTSSVYLALRNMWRALPGSDVADAVL
jgi:hypothetical protein